MFLWAILCITGVLLLGRVILTELAAREWERDFRARQEIEENFRRGLQRAQER